MGWWELRGSWAMCKEAKEGLKPNGWKTKGLLRECPWVRIAKAPKVINVWGPKVMMMTTGPTPLPSLEFYMALIKV